MKIPVFHLVNKLKLFCLLQFHLVSKSKLLPAATEVISQDLVNQQEIYEYQNVIYIFLGIHCVTYECLL